MLKSPINLRDEFTAKFQPLLYGCKNRAEVRYWKK